MYEPAHHPPVPVAVFVRRLVGHFAIVLGLLSASIALGMLGFRHFAHYSWVDAFLVSAMLLGGMGPTGPELQDDAAKLFSACYALYAGLLFIVASGVLFAPVVHRVMHRLHWKDE